MKSWWEKIPRNSTYQNREFLLGLILLPFWELFSLFSMFFRLITPLGLAKTSSMLFRAFLKPMRKLLRSLLSEWDGSWNRLLLTFHLIIMLTLTLIFALVHSGLASFRDIGEKLIGERAFGVLFSGISLPLAVSTIVYFINHRYDGIQLWQLQNVSGIHQLVWLSSFISFIFLYPSTFNLLEVAAVDKPKMHLWETGIMRITRHPQMVGQVIWCLAHTLWIGNSVAVVASVGLIGHH